MVQFTTGTFDVCNASVTKMKTGEVCLSVEYVEGHVEPASSFIFFRCNTTGTDHNGTINHTSGCLEVDPHESYTILATDNDTDAVEKINVVAPVTILGVFVPNFTSIASSIQNTVSSSITGELIIILLAILIIINFNQQKQLVYHPVTIYQ